jgi:hypothetical protein
MTTSIPLSSIEASPGAKFVEIGDTYKGRITNIEQRQQTDMDGSPKTFKDGSPMMQWVISLEQANGDTVSLFARGGKYTPSTGEGESMLSAIGTAVRAAGAEAVEVGAELAVAYTGQAEPAPGKKAKLYVAQYRPPAAPSVPVDDLFSDS